MSNDRVRDSREQQLKTAHPERVPLHEQARNKLTVANKDPNYEYRIVNDIEDRLARFKNAGWELAPETVGFGDEANNNSLGTGSRVSVGGGVTGVLMRQRKEHYDADMAAQQREVDRLERTMFKGKDRDDGLEGEIEVKVRRGRKPTKG